MVQPRLFSGDCAPGFGDLSADDPYRLFNYYLIQSPFASDFKLAKELYQAARSTCASN